MIKKGGGDFMELIPNLKIEITRKLTFEEFAEMIDNMPEEDRQRFDKYTHKYAERRFIITQLATVGLDIDACYKHSFKFIGYPKMLKCFMRMVVIFGKDKMVDMIDDLAFGLEE